MDTFGHGIAFRWRPAAVAQIIGRGFVTLLAIVLLAPAAISPANAERAVLYDEDLSNPSGQQHVGSVVWRTEITKVPGQSDEVAISAAVDVPARRFKMTLTLRRNCKKPLQMRATIEQPWCVI